MEKMDSFLTTLVILSVNYLLASMSYSKWITDCYTEGIEKDGFVLSKQLFRVMFVVFEKRLLISQV